MVDVLYNARYVGLESKQSVVGYDMCSPNAIIEVQSNLPNHFDGSAVIENLVIDGSNPNGEVTVGSTGILLKNVYNCLIRNITIRNCEVGIRVKVTEGFWSQGNRFEHIRMKNVKVGIVFEGASSTANDFSYTTIDDVRISLDGHQNGVGIKVGDGNAYANLYNAFIKATVWLDKSNSENMLKQTGLEVNGALKYSLVDLEVEQDATENYLGYGVVIGLDGEVLGNQNFLLATLGLHPARRLSCLGSSVHDVVWRGM